VTVLDDFLGLSLVRTSTPPPFPPIVFSLFSCSTTSPLPVPYFMCPGQFHGLSARSPSPRRRARFLLRSSNPFSPAFKLNFGVQPTPNSRVHRPYTSFARMLSETSFFRRSFFSVLVQTIVHGHLPMSLPPASYGIYEISRYFSPPENRPLFKSLEDTYVHEFL